jgi:hypothetical protein
LLRQLDALVPRPSSAAAARAAAAAIGAAVALLAAVHLILLDAPAKKGGPALVFGGATRGGSRGTSR